jgi:hypothetical protein
MTGPFTARTMRQLARAGFTDVRQSEYFPTMAAVRDERGGFYGILAEREAREKLLKIHDEEAE